MLFWPRPGWKDAIRYSRQVIATAPSPGTSALSGQVILVSNDKGTFGDAVQEIVNAGPQGFQAIRGTDQTEAGEEDKTFQCTVSVPGSQRTTVWAYANGEFAVRCRFARTDVSERAKTLYNNLCQNLKQNIPSSWPSEDATGQDPFYHGVFKAYASNRVSISVEWHTETSGLDSVYLVFEYP